MVKESKKDIIKKEVKGKGKDSFKKILVIVESPNKCAKISKLLNGLNDGNMYFVEASVGHIRDLPVTEIGINFDTFEANYQIMKTKEDVVEGLKMQVTRTDETILATDLDREGEGIAYHLAYVLHLKDPKRIVFNEITQSALKKAIESPCKINDQLVAAYAARRKIDRLIGYEISPVLKQQLRSSNWKKNTNLKISAGRTQSIVLKLICEKERKLIDFHQLVILLLKENFIQF